MISKILNNFLMRGKRQRTAALQEAGAFTCKPLYPRGCGVRLSSAAFQLALYFSICLKISGADSSSLSNQNTTFPVLIQIDASHPKGEFHPIWRFFGADEPNYATMKNGKKLIGELGALSPTNVFFRAHNLLTSGDGTPALKWGSTGAYDETPDGKPIYSWTILDGIFDTYLERGVKPYVEIGFMPKALSSKPEPYQHHWTPRAKYDEIFTGWAYPPKDYDKWRELVFQWTKHYVEKYGRAEVESWYWEVWNEPNIGYWRGSPQEFLKLHDFAIDGVRRALPSARVGGADTAGSGGRFTRQFLEHCLRGTNFATGKIGTPLEFLSFHAKGAPVYTNDHVRMGIANQLRTVEEGFRIISSYPELKNKPIVIGESDPEGCAACQGASLAYRNGTMYSSYTAACFARKFDLAEKYRVNLDGALTWAFEFEDQPYFAGFRTLASNGLDKPVLNVFRLFSKMHGRRLAVQSDHAIALEDILKSGVRAQPDVSALASIDKDAVFIMLWHYHDDDVPGPAAEITVNLAGIDTSKNRAKLAEYFRIDQDSGNAFAAWKKMGSPQQPTPKQYAQLEKAGQLSPSGPPGTLPVENGNAILRLTLPRQGVSLLKVSW
jgi:xylan 1,4-beta-xylosidase